MVPQELRDRVICCNDLRVLKHLNSKFNFKKLIDGKITQAPYEFLPGTEIIKRIEKGNIPNTKEVVIQAEYGAGGEGTFIATHRNFENPKFKQQLIDMIIPNEIYVVSDFINTFCSVSVHILVSDDEIGVYPPGTMIMKGPSYAGSDLFKYSQLDDDIKQECEQAAIGFAKILQNLDNVKIDGKVLTKIKVRGFFGIDLIVAKDKIPPRVFAVETNARFTGSTGLLNILCHKAKIGSVFEHTYRCFKGEPTNFTHDFAKIKPNGKKRFAEVECVGGHVKSRENGNHNMEGLNETVWQEDGIYTYSVFEEVRNFNARDDRKRYKKFLSKGTFSKRRQ